MKRKITQVTAFELVRDGRHQGCVIALADDGTLWRGWQVKEGDATSFEWRQFPSLPDDTSNLGKVK